MGTKTCKNKITLSNNVLDDNHRQIQWVYNKSLAMGGDCTSTSRYVGLK